MSAQSTRGSQSPFGAWVNKAVALQLEFRGLRVTLRGSVVWESTAAVRFRLGETWDVDIYKSMILAIEEDHAAR